MINFTEAADPIKLPNEYFVVPAVAGSVSGLKVPEGRCSAVIADPSLFTISNPLYISLLA